MLEPADAAAIASRVRAVEARTGAQVVVAMVERSDHFHGLRWRAFALGAALAALAVVVADLLRPDWIGAYTALVTAVTIIGVGLCAALLAAHVRWFERLFLQSTRAHAALNRRARELFLAREFFGTPRRNAVLLLGGQFERVVVVYADTGFHGRIGEEGWQRVVDAITPGLASNAIRPAFVAGLEMLETLLVDAGFVAQPGDRDTLPDMPLDLGDRS